MTDKKEMLGTAPVGKLLFRLALPTVVAQLINMLYNIVDRIYIGHMPEVGDLALYHRNDIKKPTDADSLITGYHFQRPVDVPLEKLFQYITKHDNYRMKNPLYNVTPKEPPRKGTHRWKREQKNLKKKKRRNAIAVVYSLLDRLECASPAI